ncbi:MAG: hypothetical protein IKW03_06540 [Clostridia bacterium]|nr:hypothetical protein [Clostridia bacterium]
MKKRILAFVITAVMLLGCSVVSFAAEHQLVYDIAFDSEKNLVTVELMLENPLGLEAADFNLGYDEEMFEYVDYIEPEDTGDGMIIAGKAASEKGLATCSVIFMDACAEKDLNAEGVYELVTFTFSPLKDDYSTEDFCFWASSYAAENGDLIQSVNIVGKQELMEERTDSVTYILNTENNNVETTKSGGTANISVEADSDWVVYLVAGVVAVGAIAGIAFVVIKKGKGEEGEESEDSKAENE